MKTDFNAETADQMVKKMEVNTKRLRELVALLPVFEGERLSKEDAAVIFDGKDFGAIREAVAKVREEVEAYKNLAHIELPNFENQIKSGANPTADIVKIQDFATKTSQAMTDASERCETLIYERFLGHGENAYAWRELKAILADMSETALYFRDYAEHLIDTVKEA